MKFNEQTKKIINQQMNSNDIVDAVTAIIEAEDSLTAIALNAYHLGLINGKRAERSRRAHK